MATKEPKNVKKRIAKSEPKPMQIHLILNPNDENDLQVMKDIERRRSEHKTLRTTNAMIARSMLMESTLPF